MGEPLRVSSSVVIPAEAIAFRAVRSSGPGGQNVNKVASKVELRVDLDGIEGLPAAARARLETLAGHRLDAAGRLVITSQASRNQARNLDDARDKVRSLIRAALVRPRPRRATRYAPYRPSRSRSPSTYACMSARTPASEKAAPQRPATATRRPQFGSPPWIAVLTSSELAIARAALRASS